MTECPDDSDAQAGSFERLIEDFADLEADLSEEARKNRQKQDDIEDPPSDLERRYGVLNEEYDPNPYLLVPHYADGDRRPIPRRPEATPPLDGWGMTVEEDGQLEPGNSYTIECQIENHGGRTAGNTHVELYVEHFTADATLDTNPETETVQVPERPDEEITLTGFTTLPAGSEVSLVGYMDRGNGNVVSKVNWLYDVRNIEIEPDDDRQFEVTVPGKPEYFLYWEGDEEHEVPADRSEFMLRVYDTTGVSIDGPAEVLNTPLLTEQTATYVDGAENEKQPLDLESYVSQDVVEEDEPSSSGLEQVDKTYESVPASGEVTTTFEYEPSPASAENRTLSVFYLRVYSLGASDTPQNWSRLDHTTSRFVGRTEVEWTGTQDN